MIRSLRKRLLSVMAIASMAGTASAEVKVDPELPSYKPVSSLSGTLNSVGSDTLNNLMTLWAEAFSRQYPNVKIQIEGKGSATAPPALAEGASQLGPMSREMKPSEVDAFEKVKHYKPTAIGVSIDALAVFVHKDNPLKGMNMQQVDGIFSKTYKQGGSSIESWGALGMSGEWEHRALSVYGRNSASGTYGFFKEHALKKGDFKDSVQEQPGSSGVVSSIAKDISAIGYSGIGYKTSEVRALPLAAKGSKYAEPTLDNCLNGTYPLSRVLMIYIDKNPQKPLDPVTAEFLRFILSKEGQEIVIKDGYYPLPAKVCESYLKQLN